MSRSGIQGFRGGRLAQILEVHRLSQAQLAKIVGVSAGAVSKWRSGDQSPERDALDRMAGIFNVDPEWFTRPTSAELSHRFFRSNASAHVAARDKLGARLEWAQDIAIALADFAEYPDVNLPLRTFTDVDAVTADEIETAASDARDKWRLGRGPVQDLALAIEGAGVILVREETSIAQIEGVSAWSSVLNRPFVLLSADKDNGYRSRFDLAHELGHLILHRYIENPNERERHKVLEQQAHRFAGAFLLPAETFSAEVRTPVTLDDLLLLKRRWGVSVAAIIMRLRALKIIDEEGAQTLFKRRSARWGAKSEPGDGDRVPERPRLLQRTVDLLADQNVMPLETLPRHIGLSASDIEMLAGLHEGYLQGKKKVVQLVRLRSVSTEESQRSSEPGAVLPFKPNSKI